MTWINADDVFSPGAFQTALGFLSAHPDRPWVTGIPSTIAANGTICDVREPPHAFTRYHLASGAHDGRERPFMQQEGTFWTHGLWSSVGGLNRHLRLAGDLDLWRRMARHAEVIVLQAVLAFHRDRSGQLSADLEAYWLEVDGLAGVGAQRPSELSESGHVGWTAARQSGADAWTIKAVSVERPNEIAGFLSGSRVLHAAFGDSVMPRWLRDLSGLSRPEGWGRWSDALLAPSARITVVHPLPGNAVVRLKMGVLRKECSPLVVTIGNQRFEVEAAEEPSHFLFELDSTSGADVIDVRPTRTFSPHEINGSADRRQLGVALFTLEIAIRRELL
jgi:hypothetical protein